MGLLQQIGLQFEFLNVFEQVFENFELHDVYYTQLREDSEETVEDDIVLVNVGNLGRPDIARLLFMVNQHNPAVVAMDVMFRGARMEDPRGDTLLAFAISQVDRFVIAAEPVGISNMYTEEEVADSMLYSYELFTNEADAIGHVYTGKAADDFVTWREMPTLIKTKKGEEINTLTLAALKLIDSTRYNLFMEDAEYREEIYYKGDKSKFMTLDYPTIFSQEYDPAVFKDKIVLFGYLGETINCYSCMEDKFYTPLNKNVGRGTADMYGVTVHANFLSMVLNNYKVTTMSTWAGFLIAFLVCYINVALFSNLMSHPRLGIWYNAISKGIQLLEAIIIAFLTVVLFSNFKYQSNLSLTLFTVLLAGDLTEIYVDIIQNSFKRALKRKKVR
jgi:CHASE2 domain-containing sensor protein